MAATHETTAHAAASVLRPLVQGHAICTSPRSSPTRPKNACIWSAPRSPGGGW